MLPARAPACSPRRAAMCRAGRPPPGGRQSARVALVSGLTPGREHGFHIHDAGDCSSGDGMSAKGHFNPLGKPHGHPGTPERHAGDMPALKADQYGNAALETDLDIITVTPGRRASSGAGSSCTPIRTTTKHNPPATPARASRAPSSSAADFLTPCPRRGPCGRAKPSGAADKRRVFRRAVPLQGLLQRRKFKHREALRRPAAFERLHLPPRTVYRPPYLAMTAGTCCGTPHRRRGP